MDGLAQVLSGLIEQYPILVLVLVAGGAIGGAAPLGIAWHFQRKDHERDASRWADVLEKEKEAQEKARATQREMLELIDRIVGRMK